MARTVVRSARAFAPAHLTGIFRPATEGRDPRGSGSIGAGVVLEVGAVAEVHWRSEGRRATFVRGPAAGRAPITADAVGRLRGSLGGVLQVRVDAGLPVGQGFGISAAGTLAASLATAAIASVPRRRAVETAHLADLFGRGGLGGVASILGGGAEFRSRPGVPPWGEIERLVWGHGPLLLVRYGPPIASPGILRSARWLDRIHRASEGLEEVLRRPSTDRLLELSERFTDRLALGSAGFRRAVRSLRHTGSWSAQAMFGNSLFVVPRSPGARAKVLDWLGERHLPAVEVRAARRGARLLPPLRA